MNSDAAYSENEIEEIIKALRYIEDEHVYSDCYNEKFDQAVCILKDYKEKTK
jgi:hypothetical protein